MLLFYPSSINSGNILVFDLRKDLIYLDPTKLIDSFCNLLTAMLTSMSKDYNKKSFEDPGIVCAELRQSKFNLTKSLINTVFP